MLGDVGNHAGSTSAWQLDEHSFLFGVSRYGIVQPNLWNMSKTKRNGDVLESEKMDYACLTTMFDLTASLHKHTIVVNRMMIDG